jgi:hypothetical protein
MKAIKGLPILSERTERMPQVDPQVNGVLAALSALRKVFQGLTRLLDVRNGFVMGQACG